MYLDLSWDPCGLHSASNVHCVTPDVIEWFSCSNHTSHHWAVVKTYSEIDQLTIVLCGQNSERTIDETLLNLSLPPSLPPPLFLSLSLSLSLPLSLSLTSPLPYFH